MRSQAPDQAFASRYDTKIAAATEDAFDSLVAKRGGSLKGVQQHEYEELRRMARLAGRSEVFADVKDLEWSYDKETGRFRRKPLGFLIVAASGAAAAVLGDELYALVKPFIFGGG